MKNNISFFVAVLSLLILASCSKTVDNIKDRFGSTTPVNQFIEHTIVKGSHNSDKYSYKPVKTTEMKFAVQFDNTAMYQTANPENQSDINKLYGFSDNDQEHHINSARIGWRWYNNQLQLFAYVYNNTVQSEKMITTVPLNQEIHCTIQVEGNNYNFIVNGNAVTMPRGTATSQAVGYQLYPYFGGNEVAPQDIRISIKNL